MEKINREQFLHEYKLKSKIRSLFEQYKLFVNNPELRLPEPKIFYHPPQNEIDWAPSQVLLPDISGKPLRFETERFNLERFGKGVDAHYFHEFTHILDYYEWKPILTFDELRTYTHLYSDFHATEIQMKKATGFLSADENKTVHPNDVILIDKDSTSIEEYVKTITPYYQYLISKKIDRYNKAKSYNGITALFFDLIMDSMYYYGRVNFLSKHYSGNYSGIINTSLYVRELGEDLIGILKAMSEQPIDKHLLSFVRYGYEVIRDKFHIKYNSEPI